MDGEDGGLYDMRDKAQYRRFFRLLAVSPAGADLRYTCSYCVPPDPTQPVRQYFAHFRRHRLPENAWSCLVCAERYSGRTVAFVYTHMCLCLLRMDRPPRPRAGLPLDTELLRRRFADEELKVVTRTEDDRRAELRLIIDRVREMGDAEHVDRLPVFGLYNESRGLDWWSEWCLRERSGLKTWAVANQNSMVVRCAHDLYQRETRAALRETASRIRQTIEDARDEFHRPSSMGLDGLWRYGVLAPNGWMPPSAVQQHSYDAYQLYSELLPAIRRHNARYRCRKCAVETAVLATGLFRDQFPEPMLHRFDWQRWEQDEATELSTRRFLHAPLYETNGFRAEVLSHLWSNDWWTGERSKQPPDWMRIADNDFLERMYRESNSGWHGLLHVLGERLSAGSRNNDPPQPVCHLYVYWATGPLVLHELFSRPDLYYVLPYTCLCTKNSHCDVAFAARPKVARSGPMLQHALLRLYARVVRECTVAETYVLRDHDHQTRAALRYSLQTVFRGNRVRLERDRAFYDRPTDSAARREHRRMMLEIARNKLKLIVDDCCPRPPELPVQASTNPTAAADCESAFATVAAAEPLIRERLMRRRLALWQKRWKRRAELSPRQMRTITHTLAETKRCLRTRMPARTRRRNALLRWTELEVERVLAERSELEVFRMHGVHRHAIVVFRDEQTLQDFRARFSVSKRNQTPRKASTTTTAATTATTTRTATMHRSLLDPLKSWTAEQLADELPNYEHPAARTHSARAQHRKSLAAVPPSTYAHCGLATYFEPVHVAMVKRLDTLDKLFGAVQYVGGPTFNMYSLHADDCRERLNSRDPESVNFAEMRRQLYFPAAAIDWSSDPWSHHPQNPQNQEELEEQEEREFRMHFIDTLAMWTLKYWETGHFYVAVPICRHAKSSAQFLHRDAFVEKLVRTVSLELQAKLLWRRQNAGYVNTARTRYVQAVQRFQAIEDWERRTAADRNDDEMREWRERVGSERLIRALDWQHKVDALDHTHRIACHRLARLQTLMSRKEFTLDQVLPLTERQILRNTLQHRLLLTPAARVRLIGTDTTAEDRAARTAMRDGRPFASASIDHRLTLNIDWRMNGQDEDAAEFGYYGSLLGVRFRTYPELMPALPGWMQRMVDEENRRIADGEDETRPAGQLITY
jgi:hypothetical protein